MSFSQKYKLKRNLQDIITFKHYPNLLATIVCTFRLILSDHTAHIYNWFIHVDSVYASWDFILELLYYHTSYIHIWSHHVGLVCFYEALLSLFFTQVTFISYHECLYPMCHLNDLWFMNCRDNHSHHKHRTRHGLWTQN